MRKTGKFVGLTMLRGYKWAISPLFPAACRYVPTCSEYAMEAVERFGVWRGGWMALARLLRCHPLVQGGYDPVVRERAMGGTGCTSGSWAYGQLPPGLKPAIMSGDLGGPFDQLRAASESGSATARQSSMAKPKLASHELRCDVRKA